MHCNQSKDVAATLTNGEPFYKVFSIRGLPAMLTIAILLFSTEQVAIAASHHRPVAERLIGETARCGRNVAKLTLRDITGVSVIGLKWNGRRFSQDSLVAINRYVARAQARNIYFEGCYSAAEDGRDAILLIVERYKVSGDAYARQVATFFVDSRGITEIPTARASD